jgi:hypothetical protein
LPSAITWGANMISKITVAMAIATIAIGVSSSADASTWRANHPRRAEVNARLENQRDRITQERKEGELTKAQAHDLRTEDKGVRAQERYDTSENGGHITKTEQARLNREENGVSQQIGK